jgi:hypothetical protein
MTPGEFAIARVRAKSQRPAHKLYDDKCCGVAAITHFQFH